MDISEKQLEANRENAKLGGIKTEEGKNVSKLNAIKHGLLSETILIKGECKEKYNGFREEMLKSLEPAGEMEDLLADRIISNSWRLKRVLLAEKNMMELHKFYPVAKEGKSSLDYEFSREYTDEETQYNEEHFTRKNETAMIANNETDKMIRYENSLERSLYKALHELQRLQAIRSGKSVSAPVAIDIDISKEQ